jgi:hypothetical protein
MGGARYGEVRAVPTAPGPLRPRASRPCSEVRELVRLMLRQGGVGVPHGQLSHAERAPG